MPQGGPFPPLNAKAQPGLRAWLGFLLLAALYLGLVVPLKLAWLERGWGGSDLVALGNALWRAAHGDCFYCSNAFVLDAARPISLLQLHFSPSLILLTPLAWLADPLRALLWAAALAPLALAAALYDAVLEDGAGIPSAWAAAAVWLFNPLLLLAVLNRGYGFQIDNLAPLFAAGLLHGWRKQRAWLFVLGGLGLAGIKEDYAVLLLLGLGAAWRKGLALPVAPRRLALGLLAVLGAALAVALRQPSASFAINLAQRLHGGEGWAHLGVWSQLLLVPFWWARPLVALAALHAGLLVALGDLAKSYFHYVPSALMAAFALPGGLARFRFRWPQAALVILGASALATAVLAGGVLTRQALAFSGPPRNQRPQLRAILARAIPPDAAVCASSDLLACVAERRHLLWMHQYAGADFILLNHQAHHERDDQLRDWTLAEEKAGRYIRWSDPMPGIALFQRASPLDRPFSTFPQGPR